MPRKRSGDGTAPPRQRQRKKKDNTNAMADMKMEMPSMSYEPQAMSNGMGHGMIPDDGSGAYGHVPDYYQYGGPTSAASGSMHNGYGPPSQLGGPPPGSATPMGFQDPEVQAQLAGHPAYGMQPGTASQPPSMLPTPGPMPGTAPNVANGVNSQAGSVPPNPMMIRHMPMGIPPPPLLEYRIHEMNKRLYCFAHDGVAAHNHLAWWEAFVHEFFDDDGKMSINAIESQEVTKRYVISRFMLIKFFRNLFDSGVKELCFIPRSTATERMTWNGLCALECDSAMMVTKLDKPVIALAQTDARMFIEFAAYDDTCGYRIKGFNLELRNTQEFISPNVNLDPDTQERLRHGLTTCGFPNRSYNFLKLSVIVESMMPIVTHCKNNPSVSPREGLKTVLFEYHLRQKNANPGNIPQQNIMPVPPVEEPVKKQARKRTRKPNNTNTAGSGTPGKQRKGNSRVSPAHPTNNFSMNPNYPVQQYPQEVLVVGEPSLMGNDFSEDDERSISRIENTQFDVTGGMGHMGANQIGMLQPPANGSGGLPSNGTSRYFDL
uniref:LIM interaction domain (LID) domain-containing protein n=1 Tax=Panagrellus redivivus TaxID=6233 RepID=A0A7E4VVX9_PANRE